MFTNDLDLNIGYDRDHSNEMDPKYFVYDISGKVIYTGKYTQCLVVIGALGLDASLTLEEINSKSEGFLFGHKG